MKRKLFVLVLLFGFIGIHSCLDNEEEDHYPAIAEHNNSYYGKGENDSLPPNENDSIMRPNTGGETGQNPVKP